MTRRKKNLQWGGALIGVVFALLYVATRFFDIPLPLGFLGKTAPDLVLPPSGTIRVLDAVDGDTITLEGGARVRYVGVDTPEKKDPYYGAAKRENARLTKGRSVRLELCPKRAHDDYGRVLGTPFDGERDLALELVRQGLGRVFVDRQCMSPATLGGYWGAAVEAFSARRGIWRLAPDAPIAAEDAAELNGYQGFVCGPIRTVTRSSGEVALVVGARSDLKVSVHSAAVGELSRNGTKLDEAIVGHSVALFGRIQNDHGPTLAVESAAQWKSVEDCRVALRP